MSQTSTTPKVTGMCSPYDAVRMYARSVAGRYQFRSPYHKSKKMLPFNIVGSNCYNEEYPIEVATVAYRGWDREEVHNNYSVASIQEKINSGFLTRIK